MFNQNYDTSETHVFIKKELEKMRSDAVSALYNAVLRNPKILTNDRIKVIQNCLESKELEDYDNRDVEEKFKNQLIKILNTIESNNNIDYERLFHTYLKMLNSKTNSVDSMKAAINFISGQSKDYRRCKELFTESVLNNLIELLKSDIMNNNGLKEYIIEIVNNYLEHEQEFNRNGLSEALLNNLISCLIENSQRTISEELIDGVLLAILVTAEKTKALPRSVVSSLIRNLYKKFENFIILILSRINLCVLQSDELESLARSLDNDYVIVEGDSIISFEKASISNRYCTSVTYLVSKILHASIENMVYTTPKTLDYMMMSESEYFTIV